MAQNARYLTKSRYKLALECPTKLYYTGKKEYVNNNLEDTFLQSLAQGGFQVGELAKLYFPGGVEITEKDNAIAEAKTLPLLQQTNATIFEAAVRYQNFFIRADILVKLGDRIDLIEVKAKSINPTSNSFLSAKGDRVNGSWDSYIADVAFQKHVLKLAYPNLQVNAWLMLANKEATAQVDGLNQLFKIIEAKGNTHAVYTGDNQALPEFGDLLVRVNVDAEAKIFVDTFNDADFGDFGTAAEKFAEAYAADTPLYRDEQLGTQCAGCEFRAGADELAQGLKSGYQECWQKFANFKEADFKRAHIFGLWNFRGKETLLRRGTYFQDELNEADIIKKPPSSDATAGLSTEERQWLQVTKCTLADQSPYFDKINIKRIMQSWEFPLHFIDFETSTVAIPFHKGRRPYEQIAFQFSHHTIDRDGKLKHAGEFIAAEPGKFPNFEFVRALRDAVGHDQGTIFRYAAHENTVLNQIREQLLDSQEADRDALCDFIESITKRKTVQNGPVIGERNMVDLLELVKKYYYHPAMGGSNSLKYVLPATLAGSRWLQDRYAKPIYGATEIPSHNYHNWQWVQHTSEGKIVDPYSLLPPVIEGMTDDRLENWLTNGNEKIANGGAALTAYARMQFVEMTETERQQLRSALLKYCELDTLAMVMLYEAWRDWVG